MNKVKFLMIFTFLYVSLFASEASQKYSCQINRSLSLIITIEKDYSSILLQTKYYGEEKLRDVAVLHYPHVIDHGHTFIAVSDNGKSGYALIRIQELARDPKDMKNIEYEGNLDINLYAYDEKM